MTRAFISGQLGQTVLLRLFRGQTRGFRDPRLLFI
jgi:hypothetical protein